MSDTLSPSAHDVVSKVSLRPVVWAVGLGVLAGFVAGPNLLFVTLLLVAAGLNIHLPSFATSLFGALGAAYALTPISYGVGRRLLDQTGLGSAIGRLGDAAPAALLDLDRYVTLGGLTLGTALAVAAGEAVYWSLRLLARGVLATASPVAVLRPRAALTVGATLAVSVVVVVGAVPRWLGQRLTEQVAAVNGADVTAQQVSVNIFTGDVVAQAVAVADPANLSRDSLRIGRLHGTLRVGQLLRGRLHIDALQVQDLETNQLRPVTATVRGSGRAPARVADPASYARSASGTTSTVQLERYLTDSQAVAAWCRGASKLVTELESLRPTSATGIATVTQTSTPLRQRRSALGRRPPQLLVRQLHCERLPASWRLGQQAAVQLSNVTSDPRHSGRPTRALVIAPAAGLAVEAHLNLHDPLRPHELRLQSHELRPQVACNLARLAELATPSESAGCLAGQGWFDRDRLNVQLALAVPTAGLQLRTEHPLAGLPVQLWRDATRELDRLELPLQVTGSLERPRLELEPLAVRERFQRQLDEAGQTGWLEAIAAEVATAQQLAASAQPQTVHPTVADPLDASAGGPTVVPVDQPAASESSVTQAPTDDAATQVAQVTPSAQRQPQPAVAQAIPVAPVVDAAQPDSASSAAPRGDGETGAAPSSVAGAPSTADVSSATPNVSDVAPHELAAAASDSRPPRPLSPHTPTVAPVPPAPAMVAPVPAPSANPQPDGETDAMLAQRRMPGMMGMQFGFDHEATSRQVASAPTGAAPSGSSQPTRAQTGPAPAPMADAVAQQDEPAGGGATGPPQENDGVVSTTRRWFAGIRRALPFGGAAEEAQQPSPSREAEHVASRPPQITGVAPPQAAPSATTAPAQNSAGQPAPEARGWKFWR